MFLLLSNYAHYDQIINLQHAQTTSLKFYRKILMLKQNDIIDNLYKYKIRKSMCRLKSERTPYRYITLEL